MCDIEKRPDGEYLGTCPVCGERKFYFNDRSQFCCHYCREREDTQGNAITFLQYFHNVDDKKIPIILKKYDLNNAQAKPSSIAHIEGGYFLVPRRIFSFSVWREDPRLQKLYIYLVGKARHCHDPIEYNRLTINRGEHVTSISKIAEDNKCKGQDGRLKKWSNPTISRMLEKLGKSGLIKKIHDTFGMHISVCNYERHQNLNSYRGKPSAESKYIEGGCFILARKIFVSNIWKENSHNLKLFIYLIGNARHSIEPQKYDGILVQRGELIRNRSEIADDNEYINGCIRKWSKPEISKIVKKLKSLKLISITNVKDGKLLISICKYDTYQNPENYVVRQT